MTDSGISKLRNHEGLRLKPYRDTVGKLTIGFGRNLDDTGISYDEATYLLATDIRQATAKANNNFSWFSGLDPIRQDVLVMLIMNMGLGGLLGFKKMLAAIEAHNWPVAAAELQASQWAGQVQPERVTDLRNALLNGRWD